MLVVMFVLALAGAHPLEGIRLTQSQMFQLQLPYRYHVSIAEIERDGLGRWELRVTDYYCRELTRMEIVQEPVPVEPPSPLRRNAVRGTLTLQIDDVLYFPDDRYAHLDGFTMVADGEYLMVVRDRVEKRTVWPLEKSPDR